MSGHSSGRNSTRSLAECVLEVMQDCGQPMPLELIRIRCMKHLNPEDCVRKFRRYKQFRDCHHWSVERQIKAASRHTVASAINMLKIQGLVGRVGEGGKTGKWFVVRNDEETI